MKYIYDEIERRLKLLSAIKYVLIGLWLRYISNLDIIGTNHV